MSIVDIKILAKLQVPARDNVDIEKIGLRTRMTHFIILLWDTHSFIWPNLLILIDFGKPLKCKILSHLFLVPVKKYCLIFFTKVKNINKNKLWEITNTSEFRKEEIYLHKFQTHIKQNKCGNSWRIVQPKYYEKQTQKNNSQIHATRR